MRRIFPLDNFKSRAAKCLSDRGQALLEFALVVPLLILLLVGIISFGLYINANVSLEQAVRIGARAASIGDGVGNSNDNARQQAAAGGPLTVWGVVNDQLAQSPGLSANPASLSVDCSGAAPSGTITSGSCPTGSSSLVTVTVSELYNPILPIPGLLPPSITLRQTYTLMVE